MMKPESLSLHDQPKKLKSKPPPLSPAVLRDIRNQAVREIAVSDASIFDIVNVFPYILGQSIAGFFFLDSNNNPSFSYVRLYPQLNLTSPFFFNIPTPFTICASSAGLLLCRDSQTGRYHVFNPFIHTRDSYRQIHAPYRTHPPETPAVLIVNTDPEIPSFHVVCAVREEFRVYSFDTFSSYEDDWTCGGAEIKIKARIIIANSGVSNDEGMAFWLTDVPVQVIKYTLDGISRTGLELSEAIDIPRTVNPWAKLRIGRLETDDMGLVASSRVNVVLLCLPCWSEDPDSDNWSTIAVMNVRREASGHKMEVVCRGAMDKPAVMRFENEVPIFTGERIVMWEARDNRLELRPLPEWTRAPLDFAEGVPYMCSRLVAADCRKVEVDGDGDGVMGRAARGYRSE